MPIKGQAYSRDDIHKMVGGGSKEIYLPNKNGVVLCATLNKKYNPCAPRVILPGMGPRIQQAARMLTGQQEAIPVFIKRRVNEWEYVGKFQYTIVNTREVIQEHARNANRLGDVSMVLIGKTL
jgi:hypothetical protein